MNNPKLSIPSIFFLCRHLVTSLLARALWRGLLATGLLGLAGAAAWAQGTGMGAAPLVPIAALDVPRYMGSWYEIALLPNVFQRNCAAGTQADYSLLPGGRVQVRNRCRKADGEMIEALGEARQIGAADSPRLEVRFAPAWLSALPFVWGDYWVIDLDPDYQLAAVGTPSRKYLWILSRSPQVEPSRYEALLARVSAQGYDLSQLQKTPQGPR